MLSCNTKKEASVLWKLIIESASTAAELIRGLRLHLNADADGSRNGDALRFLGLLFNEDGSSVESENSTHILICDVTLFTTSTCIAFDEGQQLIPIPTLGIYRRR